MKNLIRSAFYVVLTIFGLTYISLLILIGAQLATGRLTPQQGGNILRALSGKYMLIEDEKGYAEYQAFLADREALRQKAIEEYGPPEARIGGARALENERTMLQDSLDVARRELVQAKNDVYTARAEVERLQAQLRRERGLFTSDVAKETAARASELRQRFRAIVNEMDENAVGELLAEMPPDEAARWVREYMPGDFAAGALGELPLVRKGRILQLVENPLSELGPKEAADFFARRREITGTYAMGSGEIYGNLRRMNAQQAMATFMYLPEELQKEVMAFMRTPPP